MESKIYHNKEITYSIPEDENYIGEIELTIEHKHIHAQKLIDGSYATHFLPYLHYDSIEELAQEVITNLPLFRSPTKLK